MLGNESFYAAIGTTVKRPRRTRLPVHLNSGAYKQRPSKWMAFVYMVAGDGLEPTTSGL